TVELKAMRLELAAARATIGERDIAIAAAADRARAAERSQLDIDSKLQVDVAALRGELAAQECSLHEARRWSDELTAALGKEESTAAGLRGEIARRDEALSEARLHTEELSAALARRDRAATALNAEVAARDRALSEALRRVEELTAVL